MDVQADMNVSRRYIFTLGDSYSVYCCVLPTFGSVILATPPSLRMSAGTRSKAITAHA